MKKTICILVLFAIGSHGNDLFPQDSKDEKSSVIEKSNRYIQMLYQSQKFDKAIKESLKSLRVHPDNSDAYRYLAYSFFETKEYFQGLDAIKKFFAIAGNSDVTSSDYEYFGRLLAKTNQDSLASIKFIIAYGLDTTRPELLSDAARSYNKLKQYDQSLKIYTMKIEKGNISPDDWYNMGKVYYNLKEWNRADSVFEHYSVLEPDKIAGYLWHARVLVNMDPETTTGLAKPVWEQLIEKALPESRKYVKELVEAYEYLAYYYFLIYTSYPNQQNSENVIKCAEMILSLDPANLKGREFIRRVKY